MAKKLSAIFYEDSSEGCHQASSSPSPPPTSPAPEHLGRQQLPWSAAQASPIPGPSPPPAPPPSDDPTGATVSPSSPLPPPLHPLHDLPLWRADSVILPGQQALLHVHTPHYVHMFDRLFAAARRRGQRAPLFGHVRLPAGSRNLGAPGWELCAPGSRAPSVGVLMEVHRAVRLEDGKLMVLATALCRIRVRQCLSETPYSRARVDILHDEELLESWHATGLRAALDVVDAADGAADTEGPPHAAAAAVAAAAAAGPAGAVLRCAAAAAQAAASAATWRWLGYEASAARAAAWPGVCPAEGADPADTRRLVSELVDHGVLSVVPFADGPVAGRWDLAALRQGAAADAAAAAAAAAASQGEVGAGKGPVCELTATDGGASTCAGSQAAEGEGASPPGGSAGRGVAAAGPSQANEAASRLPGVPEAEASAAGRGAGGRADSAAAATTSSNAAEGPGVSGGTDPDAGGSGDYGGADARVFSGDDAAASGGGGSGGDADGDVPEEEGLTGHTAYDLLLLESRLWSELDVLAVLQARAHQQRLGLPLGLLQLRPSDELAAAQLAAAAPPSVVCRQQQGGGMHGEQSAGGRCGDATAGDAASVGPNAAQREGSHDHGRPAGGASSSGSRVPQGSPAAQPRVHPASEGLDVYCHPDYPLQWRIARLSYAAAGIFVEAQDSAARQRLLEMPSVRGRLLEVLRRARKARSILAAMAAVKALRP